VPQVPRGSRGRPGRAPAGGRRGGPYRSTCTSAESFIQYYSFLTGHLPGYDIVAQKVIRIAGEALAFPQNAGLQGAIVQIWPLDGSGVRTTTTPIYTTKLADGSEGGGRWGPVSVMPKQRYELALVQTGQPTLHIYYEPFVRSDYAPRLLASAAIQQYTGNRAGSSGAVNIRYKEFWGDQAGEDDQLLINGLNICTATLCPISKQVNAYFAFDRENKTETNLSEPDPVLSKLPFIQGADATSRAARRTPGRSPSS
jgi:hypothetical protein